MHKKTGPSLITAVTALLLALFASCSTVRIIPDGQSRLKQNKIKVLNDKKYPVSGIQPYLKQKPNSYYFFGWNPFLSVYNWSNGKGDGWDRFVKKLGVAPVIYDSSLVESSKRNIYDHLEYNGYYNSSVSDSVYTKNKKTTVTYNITLGKRYPLDKIEYIVNDKSLDSIITYSQRNSAIKKGEYLSEKLLSAEEQRMTEIIRNHGYYAFDRSYFHFEADTFSNKGAANLKIYLKNYRRNENPEDSVPHIKYYFRNVNIISNPNLTDYGIYEDPFDFLVFDTVGINGTNVIFWEKPVMKARVLANTNSIAPGALYSESAIRSTYNRFTSMRFFSSVNIQLDKADSNLVDCGITLSPSKRQGYKINFEMSINSTGLFGVSPEIAYYNKSLFGGGEWFDLSFMGNFQFKFNDPVRSNEFGVSASLSLPKFLFLPNRLFKRTLPRTELSLSYNYQSRPEYTRNIISATYGYTWNVRNRFFYRINPIQINIVKLADLSEAFFESLRDPYLRNSYQNHFDLGLGASFYYTTDASANPKNSYFYLRWQNDIAGNLMSAFNRYMKSDASGHRLVWETPYSQYYRTEVSAVYTWKFGKDNRQAVAARVLAGVGIPYGNSNALPFEKQFWAGGANSLRGWAAKSVGPGMAPADSSFRIPNQTGDFRLEANIEYRFPIVWKFAGGIFVDAGNIWNLRKSSDSESARLGQIKAETFLSSIAVSYGIGLRLDLDFVLMRIDLGMVGFDPRKQSWIHPRDWFRPGTYAVQFGVGYPF